MPLKPKAAAENIHTELKHSFIHYLPNCKIHNNHFPMRN